MLPFDVIIAFMTASILLALVPGPDNVFVLTMSTMYGRLPGVVVVLGLCTGLVVHSCAVALGVAIIFQTSVPAFLALKFIGAAYLVYLAWQLFGASYEKIDKTSNDVVNYRKLYLRGIVMNVTNPKVSIFFLAFLPQFADPARGSVTVQLLLLGSFFIVATILVFGVIALLGGTIGRFMSRSTCIQIVLNKVAASIFLLLALKLATLAR